MSDSYAPRPKSNVPRNKDFGTTVRGDGFLETSQQNDHRKRLGPTPNEGQPLGSAPHNIDAGRGPSSGVNGAQPVSPEPGGMDRDD